ncbi:MAG: ribosomal RNA small subunit methyltransferase A [Deltaproteobacteria bacterium]|nr:ribosomal RNA small subunit methyltransferase A [Deltaproteobacteria bacterium]
MKSRHPEKQRSISGKLKSRGLFLYRSRGQNFLLDRSMLEKIADVVGVSREDRVVEIGAGVGNLTEVLARRAGLVVALEVDKGLHETLRESVGHLPNVEVMFEDGLRVDYFSFLHRWGHPYRIVANLPFSISTPILFHLIRQRGAFHSLHLTFQREVANRIIARPLTRDYSVLSVMVQVFMNPRIVLSIPRTCFFPRPKVDASLVHFSVRREPAVPLPDEKLFQAVVRAAFAQRRKMLLNALRSAPGLELSPAQLREAFNEAQIDPRRRGESLELLEFSVLTEAIGRALNN